MSKINIKCRGLHFFHFPLFGQFMRKSRQTTDNKLLGGILRGEYLKKTGRELLLKQPDSPPNKNNLAFHIQIPHAIKVVSSHNGDRKSVRDN